MPVGRIVESRPTRASCLPGPGGEPQTLELSPGGYQPRTRSSGFSARPPHRILAKIAPSEVVVTIAGSNIVSERRLSPRPSNHPRRRRIAPAKDCGRPRAVFRALPQSISTDSLLQFESFRKSCLAANWSNDVEQNIRVRDVVFWSGSGARFGATACKGSPVRSVHFGAFSPITPPPRRLRPHLEPTDQGIIASCVGGRRLGS